MCQRLLQVSLMAAAGLVLLPQACFAQTALFPGDFPNPNRSYGFPNGGFQEEWTSVNHLPFPYSGINGGYSAPAYTAPTYAAPAYVVPAIVATTPATYPPVVAGEPTLIHVHVPANATVYFDDNLTKQSGADRYYRTPSLAGNRPLTYEVSARWQENGKEHVERRVVRFLPGQTIEVDFTPVAATGIATQ
jgi:uncharacterized protein (TIGR03000 family)